MLTVVVDAPSGEISVEEYLSVLGVAVRALKDVSRALTARSKRPEWKLESLHTSRPTTVLRAKMPPMSPGNLDGVIEDHFLRTLRALESGGAAPRHLTHGTLTRLHTVAQGFGIGVVQGFTVTRSSDDAGVTLTRKTFRNLDRLFHESTAAWGSVTGVLRTATVDKGRHLQLRDDVFGVGVRCDIEEADLLQTAGALLERHVTVSGLVRRDHQGRPQSVEATSVELIEDSHETFPTVADMFGAYPDFTGDLSTEEFIRAQRE
jgi:hypothetical protein